MVVVASLFSCSSFFHTRFFVRECFKPYLFYIGLNFCYYMPATTLQANEETGTVTASTQKFNIKSGVTADGKEAEFVEGFLATTHLDKGNDRFTEEALKQMAEDINSSVEEVDAVFNKVDEEQIGNLDHNNNPASPFGDTRTVPAFKLVDAKVRATDDGETGLWIKGVLNTGGMLADTVSAVKNSIRNGFLNAFSIEFVPEKVRQVREDNKIVRIIEKAAAKGAALTGRPMNPEADMTDSSLKSMAAEFEDETKNDITMSEDDVDASESEGKSEDEDAKEESQEAQEQEQQESKNLAEDVSELKSTIEEVKTRNDELEERNNELKNKVEDLKELQDIKSEVDEVKQLLEDVELEDGPRAEQEQKRFEEEQESKAAWKQKLDRMDESFLKGAGSMKSNIEAFAENHNIDTEEVKNYVNKD